MTEMINAVVFVMSRHLWPDAERCISYCLAHGYHTIGVIKDDWTAAIRMLHEDKVSVIVTADPRHLDPARTPRVEYVSLQGPSGQHRPRLIE